MRAYVPVLVLMAAFTTTSSAVGKTQQNTWCGYKESQWSTEQKTTKSPFIVQFRKGGAYSYAQNSGIWNNGKWKVVGDTIELTANNRYIVHTLKKAGDELTGSWTNKLGHSGEVYLNKSCEVE